MKRGSVVGLVVVGLLVLGVGGAVAVVSLGGDAPDVVATTAPEPVDGTPSPSVEPLSDDVVSADAATDDEATDDAARVAGSYVDYSADALASAQGQRILFFHADWCPTCRRLDGDITSQGVPDGITVLKVDYDSNQELRQKYGVTVQTTVVALNESGEATALFVPYDSPTLSAALAGLNVR